MADHDDSAAMFVGGLEDSTLSNFFGEVSDDHSSSAADSVVATAAATNNSTHSSPATSVKPDPISIRATQNLPVSAGPDTASAGLAFYPADPNWTTPFDETPPYDTYENANPFDGLYSGPIPGAQFTQQPWQGPAGHFVNQEQHPHLHAQQQQQQPPQQQQLPQQSVPPHQVSAADISPIALQAEPVSFVPGPGPVASGHFRPNPTAESLEILTPAQKEMLKSIAMPAHLQYHSPKSDGSPQSSPSDKEKGDSMSSPEAIDHSKGSSRKRKSSADDDDDDDEELEGGQPVKKTAHNMIEKRYRTNLNDKIAALRDSVPSLRIMSKSARGEDTTEDREELHGLTPAHKLNKATVLSKATEYIRHLEKRNNRLLHENDAMQQRISAFEKLFMAGAMNGNMSPLQQPPTPIQFPQDAQAYMNSPMPTAGGPDPPGMIQVPDDMKRIIQAQVAAGRPYSIGPQASAYPANAQANAAMLRQQQIQQQQQQIQQGRWGQNNAYFGKLMVGSLAGLMIVEAIRENEQSQEDPAGRGLFAVPLRLLGSIAAPNAQFGVAGYYFSVGRVISTLKLLVLFGAIAYAFVPALLAAISPKSQNRKQQQRQQQPRINTSSLTAVPSLASPIHVRRQAWLTAIQTVWVPHHNFILEASALVLKTMKLSLRNIIGVQGYQLLTGISEEQEQARVKAWTIALDAQLAGGDVEINKSRLALTLLASGTLPDTPLRLMLKALHIRVLLRQLGKTGLHNVLAANMARSCWNQARQLFRLSRAAPSQPSADDGLPDHFAMLLEHECDDVLNDEVVQRAHNLAWNRPTTHDVTADVDGMNAVVEDPAVKSPMDAVAAWWSCLVLHQSLTSSLVECSDADAEPDADLAEGSSLKEEDLTLAAMVAPEGSNAKVRAIVARAFLSTEDRAANIVEALQAMAPSSNPDKYPEYSRGVPPLIETSSAKPIYPDPDAKMALHCAMVAAHLSSPNPKASALDLVDRLLRGSTEGLTLLGFAAAFKLIDSLHRHPIASETCSGSIERLSGALRIWIGGVSSDRCALEQETRHAVVQRCLAITKSAVGMDPDPGYGSMSDCDASEDGEC